MFLAALFLSPLFSDHMVLQQDRANSLWGKDEPRQVVRLSVEGAASKPALVEVIAGADGSWKLQCPKLPAGGPYRLRLQGSTEQVIEDVLVGEVWIASGQSNMEFKLPLSEGGAEEIAKTSDSQLRMFTVAKNTASAPIDSLSGSWQASTPDNMPGFSAVAYHFARELRQQLRVPVGILHSSWGGTRVEAWTSREALRSVMEVDAELAALAEAEKDLPRIRQEFGRKVAEWESTHFPSDTGNVGESKGWARGDFDDAAWQSIKLPSFLQSVGPKINGCFWFRRSVELPASWAGRDLELSLGAVDDYDTTYFNGIVVGGLQRGTAMAYMTPRNYRIPGSLVKAGRNAIAVRVFDQFGDGGFAGPASALQVRLLEKGESLPLEGAWRYAIEREIPLVSGAVYATAPVPPSILSPQNNPAYLYNAMIAPLVGYGIRGAIWYQGEANVGVADKYQARFTAMIRDWRAHWGQGDIPFLFVQLANFKESPSWPHLREAQAQTLVEPATGMAVTIDIGNPADIHPRNKREVGRRLSLLARSIAYGQENLDCSSPSLKRIEIADGLVRVFWTHGSGLRIRKPMTQVTGFELAGPDGAYHAAEARIDGETVILKSPLVPEPRTVRYAWADSPESSLENASGLPAAPFRSDCEKKP